MRTRKNLFNIASVIWFKEALFSTVRQLRTISLAITYLALTVSSQAFFAPKWDPVDPADLAAKDSVGFPGTDVEILRSTHELNERVPEVIAGGTAFKDLPLVFETSNFVRAKIYTAKGVQDQGKLRVRYLSSSRLKNTEARVVKPDGTSTNLKKADIVENILTKDEDGGSWKQITFVFPGLEPGDVVEYRWIELIEEEIWLKHYYCQEVVPTREYRFTIAAMTRPGSVGWLNCPKATTSDKNGFTVVFRDQPAFEEEEHMPPPRELRGWIYVAKSFPMYSKDAEVWELLSGEWGDNFNRDSKPSGVIKKKAEALAAGATTADEKLRRLYEFCQKEIYNTTYRTSAELQAGIDKHKEDDAFSPSNILKQMRGRRDEINLLFASLARGLGFEARIAHSANRAEILNVKIPQGWAFLGTTSVAIKQGENWTYFNPGNYFVPYGLMSWRDEGAIAMLCNTKKKELSEIPRSLADQSQALRKARLKLDDEGTLEGDVEESYSGHLSEKQKVDAWIISIDEVNKIFREKVTARLPNAEVSDIVWTNLDTTAVPLTVKYHVRVPGYAELAGKRLIFAPSFFQVGKPVVFAAAERKHPIFFYYPWAEHDDIEIVLPTGYTLEKPSAPTAVGELAGAFGADYKLQYLGKTRTFCYRRDFALGANGACAFAQQSYPALKALFEQLYKSDTHSIVLKPKTAPAVPAASPVSEKPAAPATP
ncbi:MAG: DUF3857 and transglutaminase domain-containing protein [Verrucomicrobia bacterium]|nr:DUF3857 and transglutaminase domain-containing protein [Verrucomicrobiota bacterium]